MINVTVVLTDGITRLVQITCLKLWVISKLNLVGSMGHIEVCPCTQILVPCLVHLQAQLVTLGIHRTHIGHRVVHTIVRRDGTVG